MMGPPMPPGKYPAQFGGEWDSGGVWGGGGGKHFLLLCETPTPQV